MVLLRWDLSLRRAENVRSEVADATGYVKYNLNILWTSLSSVLVTGVLLRASQMVVIFATWRTSGRSRNGIFCQTNFMLRWRYFRHRNMGGVGLRPLRLIKFRLGCYSPPCSL